MGWATLSQGLIDEHRSQVLDAASIELKNLPLDVLRDRPALHSRALVAVSNAAKRLGFSLAPQTMASLAQSLTARIGGLGFLDDLLPPARDDLSEIVLNPNGSLWIRRKGAQFFESFERSPSLDETWRTVDALLTPIGRSLSEAQPDVDARLPRTDGTGGARIKILHPVIVPGKGYPSISIRLFEPQPVRPEQIIAWGVCSQQLMDSLLDAVRARARVLIVGSTATGKTTFLSALAHGIPLDARIVKIEDPEEIWLPHPNVTTIEARPRVAGSEVSAYSLSDGVNSAMRMSPNWLIVGEVRTGAAALALFRAQMSDHPGLSTLHAETPESAIHRLSVFLWEDAQVHPDAAMAQFAMSVDLLVQLGWRNGLRRVLGVWQVEQKLVEGKVRFNQIYSIENPTSLAEISIKHG